MTTSDIPTLTPDISTQNKSIRLHFIKDEELRTLNAEHAAKHRRCLFTDAERQQTSNELIDSVVSQDQDPGQVLLDLEQDCLGNPPEQPFSAFRGPFGVARWNAPGCEGQADTSSAHIGTDLNWLEPDEELSYWLLDSIPQDEEDHSPGSSQTMLCPADDTGIDETIFDDLEFDLSPPSPLDNQQLPRSLVLTNEDPKSWLLLSYYRDRIIRLISPLQQQHHHQQQQHEEANNPWSSLVMPCAMTTMAELTMDGSTSHARLALLNALLATSAFHLHASSRGLAAEEWMLSGDEYTVRARRHLEACLEEGSLRKKGKYKEVLMAMLSLVNAFMVKGDPDKRLIYLLLTERFIRANGFKEPALSRKRRTLHHCYAYMRIMAETTRSSIYLSDSDGVRHRDGDDNNDEFRVSRWTTLSDNTMIMEKDPDTAKRDLHLEVPGHWTSTLFPELYGVAESFLLLLSQVIRLANERDFSMEKEQEQEGQEGLGLREFTLRAKALEKSIYRLISTITTSPSGMDMDVDSAIVQSMYTALLLFFYRRIHNLDAMLLQREVLAVQGYLTQIHSHSHSQQDNGDGNARTVVALVWPAFVAACEALLPESQGYFAEWFQGMFERTGLVSVLLAKGVCEFIWARRREKEGLSWPEVLRVRGVAVLCT